MGDTGGKDVERLEDTESRSATLVALLVLIAGVVILGIGALNGRFFFVTKSTILPLLLVAAVASGRTRLFLRDWLLFLVLLLLFDTLRGSIYVAIFKWDLPWYLGYPIRLEEAILGVPSASHWVHEKWPQLVTFTPFRNFMVLVHASHFLYFLGFGFAVHRLAPNHFARFRGAMIIVMALGLLGYLVVPTVPPWMAANVFGVLPPIERLLDETYNTYVPALLAVAQVNHIAAVPSLHAAFPVTCCAFAVHLLRRRAWPVLLYTVLTLVSPIYLVEHYAIDVLLGIALGLFAYVMSGRLWPPARVTEPSTETGTSWDGLVSFIGVRHLVTCMAVFYLAIGLGYFSRGSRFPELLPSQRFIERELAGKTPLEAFFRGALALREGRHESARRLLSEGLRHPEVSHESFLGYTILVPATSEEEGASVLVNVLETMPPTQSTKVSRMVLEQARSLEEALSSQGAGATAG